jgi:hypothetical protein
VVAVGPACAGDASPDDVAWLSLALGMPAPVAWLHAAKTAINSAANSPTNSTRTDGRLKLFVTFCIPLIILSLLMFCCSHFACQSHDDRAGFRLGCKEVSIL